MPHFKYIPFERFDSFRSGRIRFTQPGAFNDPFEMPAFKAAEAEAARRAGLAGLTDQTAEIMGGLSKGHIPPAAFVPPIFYWLGSSPQERAPQKEASIPSETAIEKLRTIDQVFGILSLSMTPDNLLLWAHYSHEHRGLAIEINLEDQEFRRHSRRDHEFQLAGPVTYSSERPQIPETDQILFKHFFVKSPEWAYEQEYRIVRKLDSCVEIIDTKPFRIHLYALPPSAIRKIVFGARVPAEQKSILINQCTAERSLKHIAFAEAILESNQFKLEIRSLDKKILPHS